MVRLATVGLFLGIAYLLFWPVPIDPEVWEPPEVPALTGVLAPNRSLAAVERLGVESIHAAEDVAVGADGSIFGGTEDGAIIRWHPDGRSEVLASTGGRPLGLGWSGADLIIADAKAGLLSMAPSGTLETLTTGHGDRPFAFTDDLDVASDGTIYFSDASDKFSTHNYVLDLMEHRPNGRLLSYHPETGETRLLLDDLYFANGIALAADESFVLVVETSKYRVLRYWLGGPKSGETEILLDNLPAFPDGVSRGDNGIFWLALPSPRQPRVDEKLLPSPFLRKLVVRLPALLRPKPERYGFVLGFDATGRLHYNLQDPEGGYQQITSVEEHGGYLYLGSLAERGVGRVVSPNVPRAEPAEG